MRENPSEFQCSCFNKITAITGNINIIPQSPLQSEISKSNAKTKEDWGTTYFPSLPELYNSKKPNPVTELILGGNNVPVEAA